MKHGSHGSKKKKVVKANSRPPHEYGNTRSGTQVFKYARPAGKR